ncbi:adenosine deaminase [Colletotrichum higginsianum]|uniref:Adenosine deaminase n=1 Tax=Colletotrichum higginsianum (strain IMI 349063) TaxID=759273 RepID=H1UXC2_COLHI|nr:Adenosine deaminase [Colletotrichum higginsianum IMI 349063]OBR13236.1 Adenosine deaminase [Colletotrichum higginsianum IMI 349063]CCF32623.1 adenosine deaminase [Colletotrichum higginsianum]
MDSKPVPDMDFRALPKIELHAHLTGSISRRTLHDIWVRKKQAGETDLADPLVEMPDGKHDYNLTTFFPLFSSYIYNLITDPETLRVATLSVLQDFHADGVTYLELRTTPRSLPSPTPQPPSVYVSTILSAIAAFEAAHPAGQETMMRTRLILSVDRRHTSAQARETVLLATQFRERGVVGVDLCGDPAARVHGVPGQDDVSIFRDAFAEASDLGLGVTVHFGEAECSGTPGELAEILSWGPQRLGHVIHLVEDVKREIVERRIGLELCLSCNVHAGMISGGFEAHHFGEWWGMEESMISLGTDDVGVFGSPLSNEYRLVAEHFGLCRDDVCALARRGIDSIFGGEDEKHRLRRVMWKPALAEQI